MVQQRRPRGRDREKRVYWNETEKAVVVHEAAEIKLERPNITWGACLVEAQDRAITHGYLPPRRRSPADPLRARAKGAFSKMVEAEVQRIVEERATTSLVKRTEVQAAAAAAPAPAPELVAQPAANEDQASLKVFSQSGVKAIMEAFGPAVSQAGEIFERMIEMEFRGRVGKVLSDMGVSVGVSPILPVPQQAKVLKPFVKPKVVLAGNETDNVYFQKCAKDLEELFDFIPAKTGTDLLGAQDAAYVILSTSASRMMKGAVPHMCKSATIVQGDAASLVHNTLKEFGEAQYDEYLNSLDAPAA